MKESRAVFRIEGARAAEVLMKLVDGEHVETEYLIDHVKISGNGQ